MSVILYRHYEGCELIRSCVTRYAAAEYSIEAGKAEEAVAVLRSGMEACPSR